VIRERLQAFEGSLRDLAELANVSHVTVYDIRSGRTENPGIKTVEAIEAALDQLAPLPTPEQAALELQHDIAQAIIEAKADQL